MLYVVPKLIFESVGDSAWQTIGVNPSYTVNKIHDKFFWIVYIHDSILFKQPEQSFDLAIQKCNEHWIKFLLANNYICPVDTTSEHNCDN